jgi:Flp pilus assembly protein TadG
MTMRTPPLCLHRFVRGRFQGLAAVEFAFLLPLLVLLCFGITEGGRAVFQYNTIAKATRDAARYLTLVPPGQGHATARCLALHGNRTCAGDLLVPNLGAATVTIWDASNRGDHSDVPAVGNGTTSTGRINLVTVEIRGYPFDSLLPAFFPDVAFGPISTTMRQVL